MFIFLLQLMPRIRSDSFQVEKHSFQFVPEPLPIRSNSFQGSSSFVPIRSTRLPRGCPWNGWNESGHRRELPPPELSHGVRLERLAYVKQQHYLFVRGLDQAALLR